MPFNYEDKLFGTVLNNAQMTCTTKKYAYVPKVDILNTCGKLIRVVKQRNSILHGNIYCNQTLLHHFELN